MPKLMRVTAPWDNERDLNGMLARPWSEKPALRPSRESGTATVTFAWEAVAPDAEYTYTITTARNDPYSEGPEVVRGMTYGTKLTLRLPLSPPEHYFRFGISAKKGGRLVGDFMTHDSGVQVDDAFATEWTERVPRPTWWDEVPESSLKMGSVTEHHQLVAWPVSHGIP
jgi:hypothetical protein